MVYEYLRMLALDEARSGELELREGCAVGIVLGGLPGGGEGLCGGGWKLPRPGGYEDTRQREGEINGQASVASKDTRHSDEPRFVCGETEDLVIESVEDLGEQDVWDITVEGDHSYYAQGMFHHNSRSPSLHTIPRGSDIKRMFVSRFGKDGLILQADLSQAEVRAFCIETLDETLQDAFRRGVDPYIGIAAKIHHIPEDRVTAEQRQGTKSIVLGLLYGLGTSSIAESLGISLDEANQLKDAVLGGLTKVRGWVSRCHDMLHDTGKVVTRFGRIRDMSDYVNSDSSTDINHAENVSQNHPIQGLVGDLVVDSVSRMKYRMKREKLKSVLFNTVHDSTIIDLYIPELFQLMRIAEEELFTKLETYFPFVNVPFEIDMDLGPSWGDACGISYSEGNKLFMSGDPVIVDRTVTSLKSFFGLTLSDDPKFDPDKGKVSLNMSLNLLEPKERAG